jgi:tetratricopeptide (TPR) repeat protein
MPEPLFAGFAARKNRRCGVVGLLALFVAASVSGIVAAEQIATTAARAQTAYFAGNAAELGRLAADISPWAKSQNARELYAYAYVQFRVLQLAIGGKREDEAKRAGAACVAALDAAVQREPKFAEAFALQSACYGYLANLGGMAAIRNGSRSGKSMEAALALDARSPRILLVDGFGVNFRPKFVGGDKAKGCARFREAAAGFDTAASGAAAPAGVPSGGIDWGAAEAHYWSGRCARDTGDAAGARKAFERALAIAPDFLAASRALGR